MVPGRLLDPPGPEEMLIPFRPPMLIWLPPGPLDIVMPFGPPRFMKLEFEPYSYSSSLSEEEEESRRERRFREGRFDRFDRWGWSWRLLLLGVVLVAVLGTGCWLDAGGCHWGAAAGCDWGAGAAGGEAGPGAVLRREAARAGSIVDRLINW